MYFLFFCYYYLYTRHTYTHTDKWPITYGVSIGRFDVEHKISPTSYKADTASVDSSSSRNNITSPHHNTLKHGHVLFTSGPTLYYIVFGRVYNARACVCVCISPSSSHRDERVHSITMTFP